MMIPSGEVEKTEKIKTMLQCDFYYVISIVILQPILLSTFAVASLTSNLLIFVRGGVGIILEAKLYCVNSLSLMVRRFPARTTIQSFRTIVEVRRSHVFVGLLANPCWMIHLRRARL